MTVLRSPYARVALMWLVTIAVFAVTPVLGDAALGHGYSLQRHALMAVLTTLLMVPIVVAVRRFIDREPFADLGLELGAGWARPFLVGAMAWLAPFALGLGVCLWFGWVRIVPLAGWGEIMLFVPLLAMLVFLLEALPEELVFRGYIYRNLSSVMSRAWAVSGQAVLFSLWGTLLWIFTSGAIPFERLTMLFFFGLMLGMIRVITGSLWAAIGLHVAFQTAAQLLLNQGRGHFELAGADVLQLVALGIVPFSLAATIAGYFYRGDPNWTKKATLT
jgi:membrane protease YdiL (CAAX protease family)